MKLKVKLSTKMLIVLLAVGVLPIAAVSFAVWLSTSRLSDQVGTRFEAAAATVGDKIDRSLFERYGDVQAFGKNSALRNRDDWYKAGEESGIVRAMNALVDTYEIYYLCIFVDTEGRVIAVNSRDSGGREIDTSGLYKKSYADSPWFRAVSSGQSTTRTSFTAPGNDKARGTFVEDVHFDPDVKNVYVGDDGLTLGFSAPVYDVDGKVLGYWSNRAKFSLVEDIVVAEYNALAHAGFENAELTVLDGSGRIIVDYDPLGSGSSAVRHDSKVLLSLNLAKKGVTAAEHAISGKRGSVRTTHARKQITQVGGYAPLVGVLGYPGAGWAVLVRVPEADAMAGINDVHTFVAICAIVAVVLILGIGILFSRALTRPIGAMRDVAEGLAEGRVEQDLSYVSSDELGDLADSLRRTIEYVKDAAAAADKLAAGDLEAENTPRSDGDVLSHSFQRVLDSQKRVVDKVRQITSAARAGQLQERASAEGLDGVYQELVRGLNDVMSACAEPISEAREVLERVADRDLSARMTGDYEGDYRGVSESLNHALDNLCGALAQVRTAADQVTLASSEITTGCQSEAQSASEKASSLEEVTATLQEITAAAGKNAEDAESARGAVAKAGASAEGGVDNMTDMTQAMDRIKGSADETAKIVKSIDEIAFQTNLLALNAAVEAARAGDAGKGFAVVAEEVRGLAMRSAEAAKSTAEMIEESVRNAEQGVELNRSVTESFNEIGRRVKAALSVMSRITDASKKQSNAVAQINDALTTMSDSTQRSAATTEESASAAEELSGQARSLLKMVAQFSLDDGATTEEGSEPSATTFAEPDSGTYPRSDAPAADPAEVFPLDDAAVLESF